ncbi:MAG: hypothetical protein JXA78_05705 [Anaerolineales bacterium]|nr:hypothetical protein [Anaerolineales bacterium]
MAAAVLADKLSLAAAICSPGQVSSYEQCGRKRQVYGCAAAST